jgi:MerR family mercuric resistance operon transcriptional regulator
MGTTLTIGELAQAGGVPTSTVRYYERCGLVRPSGRTAGNYRYYGEDALERLRFIGAAQATGFTLGDIRTLLDFRGGAAAPCREVQTLLENRLADVAKRLEELRQLQDSLQSSLEVCREAERAGRCEVMEKLSSAPLTGGPRREMGKN